MDAPRLDLLSEQLTKFVTLLSQMLEKDPEAVANLAANVSRLAKTMDEVLTWMTPRPWRP
ncbi:hypothetical protein [Corallococcus exercitus]|uniref:hypothetical protein n=1 Tax=Corallococcus exercitus TaxID=2316736 RepID=UPI001FCA3156|nr:hypothetical protein [Corallococcus exercitus]